jgi:hypothetical protein
MAVAKPERILQASYPNEALLERLKSVRLADANIPEDEIFQFRRLQSLVYALRVAGYDVEALPTEVFAGACLLVPAKCKVIATRCEHDMEVGEDVIQKIGVSLRPDLIWLTTNAMTRDPRVRAMPIGLTDYCGYSPFHAIIGDTAAFRALIEATPRREDNLVLMNFYDQSASLVRPPIRQLFRGRSFVTKSDYSQDGAGYARYVQGLRSHPFCLAPRGAGIDTHRLWEALYAGCIPIVERSWALRDFEDLPILFVNRWEEACDAARLKVVRDEFQARTWDLRKLTLSYWYDEICQLLGAR